MSSPQSKSAHSFLLMAAGYWSYRAHVEEVTLGKYQELSSIGELKAQQIQQWRKVRLGDATSAANDFLTVQAMGKLPGATAKKNFRRTTFSCSIRAATSWPRPVRQRSWCPGPRRKSSAMHFRARRP